MIAKWFFEIFDGMNLFYQKKGGIMPDIYPISFFTLISSINIILVLNSLEKTGILTLPKIHYFIYIIVLILLGIFYWIFVHQTRAKTTISPKRLIGRIAFLIIISIVHFILVNYFI